MEIHKLLNSCIKPEMGQLMSSNVVRCIFTMKFEYCDINVGQKHRFLLLFKIEKIKIYCR